MNQIDSLSSDCNCKFSIIIPTWNNLAYLKLCIESITKNSFFNHQVLVHVNDGSDGTLEWVKDQGIAHIHSVENVGVCLALNGLRALIQTDYIVYMNDDMYVCPNWDKALWTEISTLPDNRFFLSSTLIQPRKFWCKSVIAPANFGETVETFDEKALLENFDKLSHGDWKGATWPPNIVHRDIWDHIGGYSIEFSPGMYSDPDFSAKLWMLGVRHFKGVDQSRVYHFEARSTNRVVKNNGSKQFLMKWGITSSTFMKYILHRGEAFDAPHSSQVKKLKFQITRSSLKQILQIFGSHAMSKKLWEF